MNNLKRLYTYLLCHIFIFFILSAVYYGMEVLFKISYITFGHHVLTRPQVCRFIFY